MFCHLNGKLVDFDHVGLPLNDLGILRGYGYFDYLRTYNGIPFLLDEHLARLERSSHIIGLPLPYSLPQIKKWIIQLVEKNNFSESHIKIVVTGGPSEDGMVVSHPSFYIYVTPAHSQVLSLSYTKGITVLLHEYLRMFPEAKTLNYMTALSLQKQKNAMGAKEIIYFYKNKILEAATSNVFMFQGNTLITPKKDILAGITRNLVLSLARQEFDVKERSISLTEFLNADEAFISASNKEIMPVVVVNDRKIADGKPGKNTQTLLISYREFIQNYIKAR